MSFAPEVANYLKQVLHKAARNLKIKNYTVKLNDDVHKGDGFLGEIFKGSILDEETKTETHLVLKKAPTTQQRQEHPIENIYMNEITFYSKVLPEFTKFEKEHDVIKPFNFAPEYITSCSEYGKEVIVLRDITFDGFAMRQKDLLLDDELVTFLFKIYGHFHAISFSMKKKKPNVYEDLTRQFHEILLNFADNDGFKCALLRNVKECYNSMNSEADVGLKNNFKKYVDHTLDLFKESFNYQGKYSGILHGDCWSNNMMFKYKGPGYSGLLDTKLIDFQNIRVGSPIYDLSYFFYTGGCKKMFDNLEHYLDIYHQSFSQWTRTYGCDPEELLPRNVLSEEWKLNSRFGVMMSMIIAKVKLISRQDSIELLEGEKRPEEEPFAGITFDKDLFIQRVRDILVHFNEIGAL